MKFRTYRIGVKHDAGEITVQASAHGIEAAKQLVCASEKCPKSAITFWAAVPTRREVSRTKSMLRNL